MHPTDILLLALLATPTTAHGVVTMIRGTDGADMPGLSGMCPFPPSPSYLTSSPFHLLLPTSGPIPSPSSPSLLTPAFNPVADGMPRDCWSNRCGSQADTAIIHDREIRSGQVGPLGRTQGNGAIDGATMVANASVGVEDDLSRLGAGGRGGRGNQRRKYYITLLVGLCGTERWLMVLLVADGEGPMKVARQFLNGLFGGGGTASTVKRESNVAAAAREGAGWGLDHTDTLRRLNSRAFT